VRGRALTDCPPRLHERAMSGSQGGGKPVCVVVGVGPGNGAAFARKFAGAGHAVALLARSVDFSNRLAQSLPGARAFACDVADAASVSRAFASIREQMGDPSVLVYNAGSGVWGSIEDVGAAEFE